MLTGIEPSGALTSVAIGINNKGQAVGTYTDTNGHQHGFVYWRGQATTLDVPDSTSTGATAINKLGAVAGEYTDANAVEHGFVYRDGRYDSFDISGASFINPVAINDHGDVAGNYGMPGAGPTQPFLYSDGKAATLDVPVASEPFISGLNNSEEVAGTGVYTDASGTRGYLGFVSSDHGKPGATLGDTLANGAAQCDPGDLLPAVSGTYDPGLAEKPTSAGAVIHGGLNETHNPLIAVLSHGSG